MIKNKLNFLFTIFLFTFFISCSGDDTPAPNNEQEEVIEEEEEEQEEEEEEVVEEEIEVDENGFAIDAGIPSASVKSYLVDANATDETAALFYNLKRVSRTKTIVGQQDAFNGFYQNDEGDSDIKKVTGNDPGLLGSDFMFITDDNNDETSGNWFFQQEEIITADVIEAYDKGMVNIFAWHLREPYDGDEFYTDNMSFNAKTKAFKSILPGGENHEYYKEKLDKVASVTSNLRGSDGKLIPIIFRPFHEFDGDWFWWGASWCTPAEYKELWIFTVEYLRDVKGVHNILYSFSPDNNYTISNQYLERYPGDDYVDILGMDNYGDFDNQGESGVASAIEKLKVITDLAKDRNKVAAFTETGFRVTGGNAIDGLFSDHYYNTITNENVEVAFMMFWTNNNDGHYIPVPGESNINDFKTFSERPETVLSDELPNMYELP